jgi:hypothetical protein
VLIVTKSFNSESALKKPFKAPLPSSKPSENVSEHLDLQSMGVEATESDSPGWTEDADLIAEEADVESDTIMDISEDIYSRMSA